MKQDRMIAVGLWVFIAIVGILTAQLEGSTMEGEPGPRFFPTLVLALLGVLSLFLFAGGRFRPGTPKAVSESMRLEKGLPMGEALAFFGVFLAGIVGIKFFGFVPSMIVSLSIMLRMAGWRLFPKAIVFSVVVIVVVFYLFDRLLQIPMPNGIFFG